MLILRRHLLQTELLWHAKIHEGNGSMLNTSAWHSLIRIHLYVYNHVQAGHEFQPPLQDYFLMLYTGNVWGNVLINQNSSSLHIHIFSYWMLSNGHLHTTETNSCTCLIIWEWKWDCDIEITAVTVLCTLLIQVYPLGPYTYIRLSVLEHRLLLE